MLHILRFTPSPTVLPKGGNNGQWHMFTQVTVTKLFFCALYFVFQVLYFKHFKLHLSHNKNKRLRKSWETVWEWNKRKVFNQLLQQRRLVCLLLHRRGTLHSADTLEETRVLNVYIYWWVVRGSEGIRSDSGRVRNSLFKNVNIYQPLTEKYSNSPAIQ